MRAKLSDVLEVWARVCAGKVEFSCRNVCVYTCCASSDTFLQLFWCFTEPAVLKRYNGVKQRSNFCTKQTLDGGRWLLRAPRRFQSETQATLDAPVCHFTHVRTRSVSLFLRVRQEYVFDFATVGGATHP